MGEGGAHLVLLQADLGETQGLLLDGFHKGRLQ